LKVNEMRDLGDEELKKQLEAAHKEYFELRLQAATKQLKNHRQIPAVKHRIARLKTILRQRELGVS
jgi:large subunit ribosomal protein L29